MREHRFIVRVFMPTWMFLMLTCRSIYVPRFI